MQIFNIAEETLAMHNDIIQNAIENNGIIFGGAVRNKIIRDHHNYKFNEYINDNSFNAKGLIDYKSEYWNDEIHHESKARTIISNDIDIYFKDKYDYEQFRNFMRQKRIDLKIAPRKQYVCQSFISVDLDPLKSTRSAASCESNVFQI